MGCKHLNKDGFSAMESFHARESKDLRCTECGKEFHVVEDRYTGYNWLEDGLWWTIGKPMKYYYDSKLIIEGEYI